MLSVWSLCYSFVIVLFFLKVFIDKSWRRQSAGSSATTSQNMQITLTPGSIETWTSTSDSTQTTLHQRVSEYSVQGANNTAVLTYVWQLFLHIWVLINKVCEGTVIRPSSSVCVCAAKANFIALYWRFLMEKSWFSLNSCSRKKLHSMLCINIF